MKLGSRRVLESVRRAAGNLRAAGVPEPEASAELLMSELLGVGRAEVIGSYLDPSKEQLRTYGAWISRRKRREPVQRILGYAYFRHLKLRLNRDTLVPRPDTESVVDAVLEAADGRGGDCRVLDLGTGSGTIAISVAQERPLCEVHAVDVSELALQTARNNARAAGAEVNFHCGDLFNGLEELHGKTSVLVSNPPYVKSADLPNLEPEVKNWDPYPALNGGPDGLLFYRRIFAEAQPLLEEGADLILEVGDGREEAVLKLGREAGFVPLGVRQDLTGTPRVALLGWRKR